jgi:hypothetical protein
MVKVTELAVAQGLDASQIDCPQKSFCDGAFCPPSMVEVFDARLDKTRQALAVETVRMQREAHISAGYFANGDKI